MSEDNEFCRIVHYSDIPEHSDNAGEGADKPTGEKHSNVDLRVSALIDDLAWRVQSVEQNINALYSLVGFLRQVIVKSGLMKSEELDAQQEEYMMQINMSNFFQDIGNNEENI